MKIKRETSVILEGSSCSVRLVEGELTSFGLGFIREDNERYWFKLKPDLIYLRELVSALSVMLDQVELEITHVGDPNLLWDVVKKV